MRPAIEERHRDRIEAVRRACTRGLVALATAAAASGCGDLTRQGQSPAYLQINELVTASGAEPDKYGSTLLSDVVTIVDDHATVYDDFAKVTLALALKDAGTATSPSAPTSANFITITRYRVRYIRADGRNIQGVDVPYGFDGGLTLTVGDGPASAAFEIVRHVAKAEAPLGALASNFTIINTIAEITFYGRDQTGREVQAVGTVGVNFGNFADPKS